MRHITTIPGNPDLFYSPFSETLIKGVEEDGKWNVYLEASNEIKDQDAEVLLCKALKQAADYYLTHGIISWDHRHKVTGDPKFIIGEPIDVAFNDKNKTLVKGWLYKENEIAQSVFQNICSKATKLGSSVGGGILRKAADLANGVTGVISKVIWDETAITHKPVNDATMGNVSLIPFPEFAKSLMAGSGVDAATFTGGRALTPENLQGTAGPRAMSEEFKQLFRQLLTAVSEGRVSSYGDMIEFVIDKGYPAAEASELIQYLSYKIPSLSAGR